jgi:SAM-dependent methyltransferase
MAPRWLSPSEWTGHGRGRSWRFAAETEYIVTALLGVDASPAMLNQARERAAEADVELDLHEGDMRELTLDEQAAIYLLPVPRAPAPTDLGRPAPYLRTCCCVAPAGRTARLERLRVRSSDRGPARRARGVPRINPVSQPLKRHSSTCANATLSCEGQRRSGVFCSELRRHRNQRIVTS